MEGLFFCSESAKTAVSFPLGTEETPQIGGPVMTDLQKKQILTMRQQNATYASISDALGIPIGTIKTFCRRNGMTSATSNVPLCKNCGAGLTKTPGAKPRLFCSDHCKQQWWNKHRYDRVSKNITQVTCLTCGEEFFDYSGANRKYCSQTCYHRREAHHGA